MAKHAYAFDCATFNDFRSQHIRVKVADSSWEKQRYFALRQQVFAEEQQLLLGQEQDGLDFRAIAIVALAVDCGVADEVIGAVRIFQQDDPEHNLWYGGRLCVSRLYRGHQAIGKGLINEAVSRAKELGCTRFLANIQPQNEAYFKGVYWQTLGSIQVAGQPHVHMQAELAAYPFMARGLL